MRDTEKEPDHIEIDKILTIQSPEYFEARSAEYRRRNALGKSLPIGAFNHVNAPRYKDYGIIPLNRFDQKFIRNVKTKTGDIIIRVTSETMEIGGFTPFIKINMKHKMVYFMTNNDEDNIQFETKGSKITYLTLRSDWEKLI